jgi:hypothetical protein
MRSLYQVLPIVLCALSQPVYANTWAQFGDQSLPCDGFPSLSADMPMVAEVRSADHQPLHFLRSADVRSECPSVSSACLLPQSLKNGQRVVVSSSNGAFACVHQLDAEGRVTSGIVDVSQTSFLSTSSTRLDDPAIGGDWVSVAGIVPRTISLSVHDVTPSQEGNGDNDMKVVTFDASVSIGPPSYASNQIGGILNLSGEGRIAGYQTPAFDGSTPSNDETGAVAGYRCRIRLRLIDAQFLAVDASDGCGRLPFDGLYRHQMARGTSTHAQPM